MENRMAQNIQNTKHPDPTLERVGEGMFTD